MRFALILTIFLELKIAKKVDGQYYIPTSVCEAEPKREKLAKMAFIV